MCIYKSEKNTLFLDFVLFKAGTWFCVITTKIVHLHALPCDLPVIRDRKQFTESTWWFLQV